MSASRPVFRPVRERPVVVHAARWDGSAASAAELAAVMGGVGHADPGGWDPVHDEYISASLTIDTLEGPLRAAPGDYVIRGVQGEYYPCKPEIFEATYEEPTS